MPRVPYACILPPDLMLRVAEGASDDRRAALIAAVQGDERLRQQRADNPGSRVKTPPPIELTSGGTPNRQIFDVQNSTDAKPGQLIRQEGDAPVDDQAVNDAYDGFGHTYDLYWQVFHRNSIDDQGMPMQGWVHYGTNYDNAVWDGFGHMLFGDGDNDLLTQTTKGLEVIGHELTHGVTHRLANLVYAGHSGALNESISDVFGSLVKQRCLNQTAEEADWLIGADIVGPELAIALRSLKAPGTANQHDTQPSDMAHFVTTDNDHGGVHTNSGIPNRAFYLVATTITGPAWEAPGAIWYDTISDAQLPPTADFTAFASLTVAHAESRFGPASVQAAAVRAAWDEVQVPIT